MRALGAGHDPLDAQHQPHRRLRPVRRPRRRDPAGVAHGPAQLERHRDLRASCTWSPGSASRSATTGCSRTARSRPPSGSSTRSRSPARSPCRAASIEWVADHRKHHAHTDEEGDPHRPHAGQGAGIRGALRGLYHAHVGWLFDEQGRATARKYARDLVEDAGMRAINRNFPLARPGDVRDPVRARLRADRYAARRADRAAVGRARPRLHAAPHDVVDQQRLPLLRHAGASPSTTTRPTSSGSRCRRSASPGTTTTTRSRARPSTGCARGRRLLDPAVG